MMRKIIKLILFLWLSLQLTSTIGQTWAPTGAKWTYTFFYMMVSGVDTFTVRSIGDTTILSHTCKILKKSSGTCDARPSLEYMYSDSGKVFLYDNSRYTFQLLYNFNANIGDSSIIFPGDFPSTDSIVTIVDSISTININSHILKKLYVHRYSTNQYWTTGDGIIIENIGDTYYMFPWYISICDAQWAGPLRCYEDTMIGFHDFGTAPSCDYTNVGITEIENNFKMTIYPNPALDQITIENNSNENFEYLIYNYCGQLQKTGFVTEKFTTIPVGDFSVGLYNIVLRAGSSVITKKIIIEK